jgi:hypothetical protein
MLLISLGFSAVLFLVTLVCVAASKEPRKVYPTVWFGLLFGFVPGMCILPAYLLHALLTGCAAMLCRWGGAGVRGFALASIMAFAASYGAFGIPRALDLWRLAKEYPVESLKNRLAYEPQRQAQPIATSRSLDDAPELGTVWDSNRHGAVRREWALKQLHEERVKLFVSAPGFGIARMYSPSPADIRRAEPIRDAPKFDIPESPAPGTSPAISAGDLAFDPSAEAERSPYAVVAKDLQFIQAESAGDFLNPLGFGYVRDREHVSGFLSHRLTRVPPKPQSPPEAGSWRFESLDLISLLKYPEPVAYVSKHLPQMDELRDAPTRPLDEFEAQQLPRLRIGDQLAFNQGARRVRMLGAIRARAECLNCHYADTGELLGAFSYDLRRDQ